jgi:hypothetical protein
MRGVQFRRLDDDETRLIKGDAVQLIALLGRRQVVHHQHEVVGALVDVGVPSAGRADSRGWR